MKVLLVNGSPRQKAGSSEIIARALRGKLGAAHEYRTVFTASEERADAACAESDLIVFAFPLYIDSLPFGLIRWLCDFRRVLTESGHGATPVYAIANCGFYEGEQNKTALDIMRNFCEATGLAWKGGIGIGTGEMIRETESIPENIWIKRPVWAAIDELARAASASLRGEASSFGNRYVHHAFPRFLFKFAAESGWKRMLKKNGVAVKAISAQPYA
jgi:hypothetical protein